MSIHHGTERHSRSVSPEDKRGRKVPAGIRNQGVPGSLEFYDPSTKKGANYQSKSEAGNKVTAPITNKGSDRQLAIERIKSQLSVFTPFGE